LNPQSLVHSTADAGSSTTLSKSGSDNIDEQDEDESGLWMAEAIYTSDSNDTSIEFGQVLPDAIEQDPTGASEMPTDTQLSNPTALEVSVSTCGQFIFAPDISIARAALKDLETILRPQRVSGIGHKPFPFRDDDVLRNRLDMMRAFLQLYGDSTNNLGWKAASLMAARTWNHGEAVARLLHKWTRSFIEDRDALPFNLYGTWNTSLLHSGDLAQDIFAHLQTIGKYVRAQDVVDFVCTSEIQEQYSLMKTISLRTAQRWMNLMHYRWTKEPSGQYSDGHEREDVVAYQQEKYIPAIVELQQKLRCWNDGLGELQGGSPAGGRNVVIWYHDESIFYAHDRRTVRWVHETEKAIPHSKGEGTSLMVADFVSADYGWLHSPDGKDSA